MSLQVLVNGFDVTNGITHRINWVETSGLFDPAALVDPEAVDTFEGPYRVRQTTVDYGMREVSISGILIVAASDYASKLRALDGLQAIYAPRPSRVVVGTLELSVDFGRVQVAADQLKRLNGMIKYTVTGTAIPATFACVYGNGTGLVQGIPVDTQRVNEAATLATMASGVGTITNPGDVPTPAVLTIQGAASTVYYLATSATGRRVPISTDANGVGRLDERAGLYLAPGVNRITAYSAATGTATLTTITVMSFFGTTWRYSGNAVAGTDTMFNQGPALTVNRTGSARVFRGNTNPALNGTDGIVTAGDDEPRIGWVWQNRRNLITPSQDLFHASWGTSNVTRTSGGAVEPFGFSGPGGVVTLNDTTTGALGHSQYSMGSLSAISYVASVYILKDSVTSRQAGFTMNTTGGFAGAILNTSTGVASRSVDSSGTLASATVTVSDAGLWWRLAITWTGEAANNWRLTPALSTNGANTGGSPTGSAVFACPQVEIGTTPTAYQATDASGISLDHPANDAGLVLEGTATNLCLRSEDIASATWSKNNVTNASSNNLAPDGTLTAYQAESTAADSFITQGFSGLTIGSNYTFSVWLRATTGVNTVNIYINEGASGVTSANIAVTTNWSRVSVTRALLTTNPSVQIGGGSTWSTGEVLQIWGAQLELGTAATSYIPTTTVSVTRLADVAGLVSPHNLLTYSDQFDNAAWVKDARVTVTSNVETGPDGISNADRVVVSTAAGGDNIRLAVPTNTYEVGKAYTLSCWVKTITGTPTMRMFLNNAGPAPSTFTPTTSWQRFSATVVPTSAASDGFTIDFNNVATGTGYTIALYGAQLTEGYLPGRYVRTTDTQVLPVSMIDPSWSQNGYIEADILWPIQAQPPALSHVWIGTAGNAVTGAWLISNPTGGSNIFNAERWSSGTGQRLIQFTDATLYSRGYARLRIEWTNYVLSGSRYMFLRLYADGVMRAETNFAGTAGSSWPSIIPAIYTGRLTPQRGEQTTISNLVIGTPSLPEGATAAGI